MRKNEGVNSANAPETIRNFDEFVSTFFPVVHEQKLMNAKNPVEVGENIVKIVVKKTSENMHFSKK